MLEIGKKYFILIFLLLPIAAIAQSHFRFSGKIMDKASGEKLEMVAIQIKELNRWTTSSRNGEFILDNIPQGSYTFQASCLGYQLYEINMTVTRNIEGFKLLMNQQSLGLEEVVIVAKENTNLSSSSKIESAALEHVQPNSLADLMQLVPGQITLNPNLAKTNQISIRDINDADKNPDNNSAMGTAIIIDGTPINNDANMQTLNTAGGGTAQGYSTAGQGIDLRQIATDNIESVEVIRGIPSVEYGELTTGAVLVKTKAGKTRLNVKLKADPRIKQSALSKGFLLPGEDNGAMNIDFDYTNAFDDLRQPTKSYKRLTGQLGYSNTYFRQSNPLSVNTKCSFYSTFDNSKSDPDMLLNEIEQSKEQSLSFKLYGNWSLKKSWITSLAYNFSGDFQKQKYYEYKVTTTSGATPLPTSLVSGESVGTFLPSSYNSELTIDGRPYNYFAMIKGNTNSQFGNVNNILMYGAEWRSSGNKGEGRIYDITRPPSGAISTRPRAFKDVPANENLALFLEEKVNIPIGVTRLRTQFGLRYNNMLPTGIFSTNGFKSLEPRINLTYDILKKKKNDLIHDLALRFGYGKTSKTPSMIYLYPDKSYHDEISFNYYPDLLVITTQVVDDVKNPDLKPITNKKLEVGLDFNIKGINVLLTGFKEKIENGFSWESEYYAMNYKSYSSLSGGKSPYWENGQVYYQENGQTIQQSYTNESEFASYQIPKNSYNIDKKGIEYVIDFGNIKSIQSNFSVDGAFYDIKKISKVLPYAVLQSITYQGLRFPYLPVYPGGKGNKQQRFNSNFQMITHIPKLKMITSLSAQMIWVNNSTATWEDDNGTPVYYAKGDNNEKIYGQTQGVDKVYVDPIGFYDKTMEYHNWQQDNSYTSPYSFMVSESKSNFYNTISNPILCQINLKLTKEIGRGIKFSFFANNILNHRPLFKDPNTDYYSRLNESAYFGAEFKFSL